MGFGEVFQIMKFNQKCRVLDAEIEQSVEKYKQEEWAWYNQRGSENQNPFTTAIQPNLYQHYLERKRLDRKGISLFYEQLDYLREKGQTITEPYKHTLYKRDGKNLVCIHSQKLAMKKAFVRNNALLYRQTYNNEVEFICLQNKTSEGNYICPNCGAEMPLDQLLNGCDYCGTKFDVNIFHNKIASVFFKGKKYLSRQITRSGSAFSILAAPCWGIALVVALLGKLDSSEFYTGNLAWILFIIGWIFMAMYLIKERINGVWKHNIQIKKIRKNAPDFSVESMIARIDNKIAAIHYADQVSEIAPFTLCNQMQPFIQEYANVISCIPGAFFLEKAWMDQRYQNISLKREVTLVEETKRGMRERKEYLRIVVAKKAGDDSYNDVTIYKCDNCGSSISLIEGGKCRYCGTQLNLIEKDWVITDYQKIRKM